MPQIMTTEECVRRNNKTMRFPLYLSEADKIMRAKKKLYPPYVVNCDGKLIAIDDVVGT